MTNAGCSLPGPGSLIPTGGSPHSSSTGGSLSLGESRAASGACGCSPDVSMEASVGASVARVHSVDHRSRAVVATGPAR